MKDLIRPILQEKFGMRDFRPSQLEAIEALLRDSRLLAILPTGYGKSLLYQIPSCLLGGITLVISPLLALMRDQMDQLKNRFKIEAASINSDQTEEENAFAKEQALKGALQILFVSPEMLDHVDRFEFLANLPITLLVIDEAHCVSTWGHDFRPSYRLILKFSSLLEQRCPNLKILALTATADSRVETDIVRQLSSPKRALKIMREKMDRPNIHLSLMAVNGISKKLSMTEQLASKLEGHGLIYTSTRENAELVADFLNSRSIPTIAYHAGLESEEKRRIQIGFSNNQIPLIAATTALGMGIDKKDLRFVLHFDIPGSITAYYQEVGRVGRDGEKANGILLYDPVDRKVQDYFIASSLPDETDFQRIMEVIRESETPPNLTLIKRKTGLHPTRVTIVLAELVEQGFLNKRSLKGVQVYEVQEPATPLDLSRYTVQHLAKKEELSKMIAYAEMEHGKSFCRMATLRSALGDHNPNACGRCDLCRNDSTPFTANSKVAEKWLSERSIPIQATKTHNLSTGFSLYDGKLRQAPFIRLMQNRQEATEIDAEIIEGLKKALRNIAFQGIILLPSRTWSARSLYGIALASHFQVALFNDLLVWKELPEKRQGELFNNDQRHYNVHQKMALNEVDSIPEGALLLLDDYIGSGSTMKEAARTLRKKIDSPLIPVTLAQVKWHLGKAGFV